MAPTAQKPQGGEETHDLEERDQRQRGDRLGRGSQDEACLRGGRVTAGTVPAKAACVHDLVAFDDDQIYVWDVQAAYLPFDEIVTRF